MKKCLFAHSVCANFGLNAHTLCANFGLNAHIPGYLITYLGVALKKPKRIFDVDNF